VSIACSRNVLAGQSDADVTAFIAPSPRRTNARPPYAVPLGVVPFDWEVDGAAERIFRAVLGPDETRSGRRAAAFAAFPSLDLTDICAVMPVRCLQGISPHPP